MPFHEGFISELVGRKATFDGLPVGHISDFLVAKPDDVFPEIDGLVIRTSQGPRYAPLDCITELDDRGTVVLATTPHDPAPHDDDALYLVADLLDKQIVDVNGRRVVRINDIELAQTGGKLRIVAADVGVAGIMRRLGLKSFGKRFTPFIYDRIPRAMIAWDFVAPIRDKNPSEVRLSVSESKLARLHPSDLAEIIGDLSAADAAAVVRQLSDERAADALEHLDSDIQLRLINDLGTQRAADIIEEMDADDAADLLAELPEEKQSELFAEMDEYTAGELRTLVKYHEDTAGGLMTTDYTWIYPHRTTEATIQKIREIAPTSEFIYYLYVIDKDDRLLGILTLRDLLLALPTAFIGKIMRTDIVTLHTDTDAQEAAAMIARYDLLALPVVTVDGKMLGIVTVDDAIDAIMPDELRRNLPRFTARRHKIEV